MFLLPAQHILPCLLGANKTLGGGEPTQVVPSVDPPLALPISSKATVTEESWTYDPGWLKASLKFDFSKKTPWLVTELKKCVLLPT